MTTSDGAAADLERRLIVAVMASEKRGDPPWQCAAEVVRCCGRIGTREPGFPNADLASILVSNLCFSHSTSYMWKLLEQAMATHLVNPLHVLALLTSRVNQNRREQPAAYMLYLELMRRYAVSFSLPEAGPHKEKMTKSIDDALQLSDTYQVKNINFGMAVVLFLLRAITNLLDCTLEDWGFLVASNDQIMTDGSRSMDVDVGGGLSNNSSKNHKKLRQINAFMALEVIENMCSSKFVQVSLRLVHLNLSELFEGLFEKIELIKAQNISCSSSAPTNHLLQRLFFHVKKAKDSDHGPKSRCLLGHMFNTGLVDSPQSLLINSGKQSCWIAFDIFMEHVMDGKTFSPAAAFEIITVLTKTLQIINQASWQETFQALWISALRLVQRAKDPMGGPIPYMDSRLSMLLSIVPLSIAPLLKEENNAVITGVTATGASSRKQSFVACLQSLTQFASLLHPPPPVVSAASDAATKAALVVMEFKKASGNSMMSHNYSTEAVGNLLHLVVESCIARDMIDTSAYFWLGYMVPCGISKDSNSTPIQDCPWSNFMQGAPLTRSLQSALITVPAPSVNELKKLNHLALHGSEEERSAAPKILCGASLIKGWRIQEHVVHVVVKLLSPQMPLDSPVTGDASPYLSHLHMLTPLLTHLCRNSVINILALYGIVPEVVASLMPLCEALGSFPHPSTHQSSTGEEVSAYSVFSLAFLFLLRLCKFYGPDKEPHPYSYEGPARPDLKLDFLLLMRDNRIHNNCTTSMKHFIDNVVDSFHDLRCQSVHVDSLPKLRAWYFENQACLVPDISDKCNPSRVHRVADKILVFICHNMNKLNNGKMPVSGGGSSISASTSTSSSTIYSLNSVSSGSGTIGSTSDDKLQGWPLNPAWELLEAIPLVLEAILTACAYGQMSSRDLTTGLRDLVEFFPASIATIIRYLEAEISRGTWKSVSMNGIDWPSSAEALNSFGSGVKEVLERVGVHIETCHPEDAQLMLPLPLAAFLSLTITFKLDKNTEYAHAVMGQSIKHQAIVSPWPITLAIGALWAQKAPTWQDFTVFYGVRSHFTHNKDAINQLLQSCFKALLGPASEDSNYTTSTCGVVGLLGESVGSTHAMGPGIFFLCTCHMFHAPCYFSEVILKLVVEWACKLADKWTPGGSAQLKFGQLSLATAISQVRQVAMLGTSLLCIAGWSQLVRVLFEDTIPIFLLSEREERSKLTASLCSILEGYAISYLLFFSTAVMWGVGAELRPDNVRGSEMSPHVIASHLDFIAKVIEGKPRLRCDPAMWKAHVSSFVGLIVRFSPAWVLGTKLDILKKISSCLKGWHEYDLALSLLELGGASAMEASLELL